MVVVPMLPLSATCREVLDFCLTIRTVGGFIELYEQKLLELHKPGVAYEATEQIYGHLFGHRRYKDRESFYNVLHRHRS